MGEIKLSDIERAYDSLKKTNAPESTLTFFPSPVLPFEETAVVCDIETREEIRVLTGNKVHCMKAGIGYIVSSELFEQLKKYSFTLHEVRYENLIPGNLAP